MGSLRITATIITKNEEATLPGCLSSLAWADEILVLDSGSTDGTVDIATSLGATVHRKDWEGYAAQKNAAASLASHDWIFNIDADERAGRDLAEALATLSPGAETCYSLIRISDFLGAPHRPVHRPSVERLVRLYDRRQAGFGATAVHEKVVSSRPAVRLAGTIYHEGFRGIEDFAERLNRISSLSASEQPGSSALTLVAKPFARLCWTLFRHGLALDGRRGFILAFMWAHHDLLIEAKRFERELPPSRSSFDPSLYAALLEPSGHGASQENSCAP